MAISTLCPGCKALFRLADELAGKQVRCQKCGQKFIVPGTAPAPPAPPVASAIQAAPPPPKAEPLVLTPTPPPQRKAAPPPLPKDDPDDTPPAPVVTHEEKVVRLVEVPTPVPPERGRRRVRPVQPRSAMAVLVLLAMFLVLFGSVTAGGAVWIATSVGDARTDGVAKKDDKKNAILQQGGPVDDALAKRLTLKDGFVQVRGHLDNNDAADRVKIGDDRLQKHAGASFWCKTFLVELKANTDYIIDLRRMPGTPRNEFNNQFGYDPFLRLETLAGLELKHHDDINPGFDQDSRIEYRPTETATYRIVATSFNGSVGQFALAVREARLPLPGYPPADIPLPQPVATDRVLFTTSVKEADGGKEIEAIAITGFAGINQPDACWAPDGKSIFMLSGQTLHHVNLDNFRERRKLDLGVGRAYLGLARCSEGLLVPVLGTQPLPELWLISPDTLEVTRRWTLTSPPAAGTSVAACAKLPTAFISCLSMGAPANAPAHLRGMHLLDVSKESAQPMYLNIAPQFPAIAGEKAEFLFSYQNQSLARTRLSANGPANATVFLRNQATRIDVSADGKYVAPVPFVALPQPGATYDVDIHSAADLNLKPKVLRVTGRPCSVAFHPQGKWIAVAVHDLQNLANGRRLQLFDEQGKRIAAFPLGGNLNVQFELPMQLLMHPDGKQMLIRFSNRVCLIRITKDGAPTDSIADPPEQRGPFTFRAPKLPNHRLIEPCWDADGTHFFHLEDNGTLHRIKADGFTPAGRVELGQPVVGIGLSAEGLVVPLKGFPQVLVVNPETLAVTRRITIPNPASSFGTDTRLARAAVVAVNPERDKGSGPRDVYLLDLKDGIVLARDIEGKPPMLTSYRPPLLTPDGQFILLVSTDFRAHRVRIRTEDGKTKLVQEEERDLPTRAASLMCLSADGKHVGWFPITTTVKVDEIAFYPVEKLKGEPAFRVPGALRALSFSARGGLYAHNPGANNLTWLAQPAEKGGAALSVAWDGGRVRTFVPHPQRRDEFLFSTFIDKSYRVFHGTHK